MYFTFKGRKVYYEVVGRGEPLLFLHGWGGKTDTFSIQREYFSKTRTCILIDFSGFGKSDMPEKPMSVSDYKDEVLSLLGLLDIEKTDIIAHSFGGRVAFKLLSENEDRVRSAVLVSPAGLKTRRKLVTCFKICCHKIKRSLYKKKLISSDFMKKDGSNDYKDLSPVMKETFKLVIKEDLKKDIKRIKRPVFLIYGIKDREVLPKTIKRIHKLIKSSDIKALFGGHFCFIDDCMRFNIISERFLEEV